MSTVALPIVTSVRLGNGRFSRPANEPRAARATRSGTPWEVLLAFLQLGLTSFGGPFAHLGYFRSEFVERRRWVSEDVYADLVALGQFLPGPASSQVGMALGMVRAGPIGMAAAWLGFTLPSAALMIAFAFGVSSLGDLGHAAWLKGLKLVAVAVVAQAVWGMARNLCPDRPRATLAVAACLLALTIPSAAGQISAIALGAAVGYTILPREPLSLAGKLQITASGSRMGALCCLALFFGLLFLLPALADVAGNHALNLIAAFYRVGSLIFGGGHVMMPLLRAAVVPPGWISNDTFLAGYGAAQAIPGPLSSFAGYLGVLMQPGPNGWLGGVLCIVSIFLPSFLLVAGALPFWDMLRGRVGMQATLRGVNAAVVGLVLAALFSTMWLGSVVGPADFGLILGALLLLAVWKVPPWLVVVLGAVTASALSRVGVLI